MIDKEVQHEWNNESTNDLMEYFSAGKERKRVV